MTAATMSSTLTRSTRACRCSVVVAGVNRLQATSRPSTTLRPTRRTRRECGSGPAAAWRSVCGYVDALARCPACGRRSVSAIPQLCFSTASNRPVTLAPRDDELWAALGLLFLSGQRGALLLQRAVGPHSAVERACHGAVHLVRCRTPAHSSWHLDRVGVPTLPVVDPARGGSTLERSDSRSVSRGAETAAAPGPEQRSSKP
jgi:hypothetical protein